MKRLAAFLAISILTLAADRARACGCFNPPSPAQPVVQTGERILFHVKNGLVTAHVQIAFGGEDGSNFGWILPLPSLPTLEIGSDEVFTVLGDQTGPRFDVVTRIADCSAKGAAAYSARAAGCDGDLFGCGGSGGGRPRYTVDDMGNIWQAGRPNPVVLRDTVGPYDYVVLKADDKQALIDWLGLNRFFLPTTNDDVLKRYIGPGLYFLALKLAPGRKAGDIAPVVVRYNSDLPMIPLVLTSATTIPTLPVTVWVLGGARAIPRNFHHVVINDSALAWLDGASNYADLVRRAVLEAPGGRAFVTESAGDSKNVQSAIPAEWRDLFDQPKLTRLFTMIGAEHMTQDPVFSFNPDLSDVSPALEATLIRDCNGGGALHTPQGFEVRFDGTRLQLPQAMPSSSRVEILRESGPPSIVVDNSPQIAAALAGMPFTPPDAASDQDGGIGMRRAWRPDLRLGALFVPLMIGLRARRSRRRTSPALPR